MPRAIFREENSELFAACWQDYLKAHPASPYYLLTVLDYFLAYSRGLVVDKSFVLLHGEEVVACVFLPIEENNGRRSISIGQSFAPSPLFLDRKNLAQEVMTVVERLAQENGVKKIMFRIDVLQQERYPYNFLLRHDFLDASLLAYLVNCENPGMRRNHERAVRKIQSNPEFTILVMDKQHKDYEIHEEYRRLHHRAAGKVTRPKGTFDLQYRMLEEGNAILVGLRYRERFIAFTYFVFYQQGAISFSAADDPEFNNLPLYHVINAEALNYLKEKGIKYMDMGQPLTTSLQLFYYPDEKQKNIALFKTGFGGKFVQDLRGVKYLSRQAFRQDIDFFSKEYEKTIIQ